MGGAVLPALGESTEGGGHPGTGLHSEWEGWHHRDWTCKDRNSQSSSLMLFIFPIWEINRDPGGFISFPPVSPASMLVPGAQENANICRMNECVLLVEGNTSSCCSDPFLFQTSPPAPITSRKIFFSLLLVLLHESLCI